MYETFGAVVNDHRVEFRLFFPDVTKDPSQYSAGGLPRIQQIQVTGDFQHHLTAADWDLSNAPELMRHDHPKGWLYTFQTPDLPDGFYQYKYFVTYTNQTTRWCGDPCTKYVATANENSAFVIGGNDVQVRPLANRLHFDNLIIYELMIDDFTKQYRGVRTPIDAVRDKFDYLVDLGINAIEFMPWTAWRGGEFSWGYDPFLFFAVENRYVEDPQNPLDRLFRLQTLVNDAHDRGLHVIMDGVFNHVSAGLEPGTGFPYHWLYQDPSESPFTGRFGDAQYFEDLDYNNECAREFIFDACRYWLDTYSLDGIRFDYTKGFFIKGDRTKGITRLITDLRTYLAGVNRPNISLTVEHLPDNRYEAIGDTNEMGATGCWYDRLFYDIPDFAAQGNISTNAVRVMDTCRDFDLGKGPVIYVENHDHSTLVNRMGGRNNWWRAQPALLGMFCAGGAILIHNGQEFGDDHALPNDGPERVQSRPVQWELLGEPSGQRLLELHKRLIKLRRQYAALRSPNYYPRFYDEQMKAFNAEGYGVHEDKDMLVYHRWVGGNGAPVERFMIILNFSAYDQYIDIPFAKNGMWVDRLNGDSVQVSDFKLRDQKIESHWGKIYHHSM